MVRFAQNGMSARMLPLAAPQHSTGRMEEPADGLALAKFVEALNNCLGLQDLNGAHELPPVFATVVIEELA